MDKVLKPSDSECETPHCAKLRILLTVQTNLNALFSDATNVHC
jgi:hypothetical protein